jgi:hypothetical protein
MQKADSQPKNPELEKIYAEGKFRAKDDAHFKEPIYAKSEMFAFALEWGRAERKRVLEEAIKVVDDFYRNNLRNDNVNRALEDQELKKHLEILRESAEK